MAFRKKPGFTERKFWEKVRKTDGCWIWTGSTSDYGHGEVRIDKKLVRAHRVVWEWLIGPIPDGMCVLHSCDNPPCVNPDHLFVGTKKDNTQDMMQKGRNRYAPHRGEAHGNAVLMQSQVDEIRGLYATGRYTQVQIAAMYGTTQSHVSQITRRAQWKQESSSA